MKQIIELLIKIGLSDTEAAIYTAGLKHGPVGIHELTKQTGVQRTTVYHALDTLTQKGLASKQMNRGRAVFSMHKPEQLGHYLDQQVRELEDKKQQLDELLPRFIRHDPSQNEKIIATQYEGIEGIKAAVDEALYCRTRKWDIIAPKKNFFSEFESNYAKYFMGTRAKNGIFARTLWEAKPSSATKLENRQPRILPEHMHGKFRSVIIIFDDKVLFVSSFKNLTAVLIHSNELNETMKTLFTGLWSTAKPFGTK